MKKVINYYKSEDHTLIEKVFVTVGHVFLAPMSISGIIYIIFMLVTGQADTTNVSFGIYG